MAEDAIGMPARRAATRATFMPCSPSGMAQPIITSSTSCVFRPGTRPNAPCMATAARSSGRVARNIPLGALPTAVRTALTITASLMDISPLWRRHSSLPRRHSCRRLPGREHVSRRVSTRQAGGPAPQLHTLIPKRLPALQGEGDPLLGFLFAAKREERFPLQIQQILLAFQGAGRDGPAAQNVRHPIGYLASWSLMNSPWRITWTPSLREASMFSPGAGISLRGTGAE